MQVLSCLSPSVARDGSTLPEMEQSEVAQPATERLMSIIRFSATKPDLGSPLRVPLDSNGQRLCPTPKTARTSGGMKNPASRSQESPGTHVLRHYSVTTAFLPLETIASPAMAQRELLRLPVDSNGQKLCPTPKRTHSSTSPGASNLRFLKAASFQPLETLQSPSVLKNQTKRVLVDSNGQRAQVTSRVSKHFTTPRPRDRANAVDNNRSENMAPRALFNDSHVVAPRSISRVFGRACKDSTSSDAHDQMDTAQGSSLLISQAIEGGKAAETAVGPNMKKRERGEDDAMEVNDNARVTRSKTEAEKIATFLKSPAARVRPDGTREDYHGASYSVTKQIEGKNIINVTVKKKTDASSMEESSIKPLVSTRLSTVQESPAIRVRVQSPGRRGSLLRSPLVTSSKKQSEKKMPPTSSTSQGSVKKNLSVLLAAEK